MIIVKLKGGLGNQMFQYAFGKKIALINKTKLILDNKNGFFKDPYQRKFGLHVFNIRADFTSVFLTLKLGIQNSLYKILNKLKIYTIINNNLIKETSNKFASEILRQYDKTIYFDGYWQSEKYFCDIKDLIITDFTCNFSFPDKIVRVAEEIKNCYSVSVHFRDYNNLASGKFDKNAISIYNKCSVEYYNSAIMYIRNINNNIRIFVFSECPLTISNINDLNIPITYINGNKDYEDLYLMSLCKYNIIANSSFSWWGAWLNENKDKIIIAPSKWYKDPLMDTCDLIPNNWIRI